MGPHLPAALLAGSESSGKGPKAAERCRGRWRRDCLQELSTQLQLKSQGGPGHVAKGREKHLLPIHALV